MARQRGGTFQADFRPKNGKRVRPGGFPTMAAAELWEAQARANDEQGLPLPPLPMAGKVAAVSSGAITLGELRKLCLTTPKQKGGRGGWLGSKDYRNAEARSQMACDFWGEAFPAGRVDLNELERYARACRTAGNRPATINRKLANVSKMLTFAEARGLIAAAPATPLEEEPEGRVRFLTPEEEQRGLAMLEIMGEHDARRLAVFLIDTGARVSEALKLDPADVNVLRPSVTFWETKGGKARTVPLTPRALEALGDFQGRGRGPFADIPYWDFRYVWERARKRLGPQFDDAVIHVFRHTCISRLVQGGMDLRRVQVWAGHADIKTTLRYAHLAPDDLNVGLEVLARAALATPVPLRTSAAGEQTVDNVTALVPKRAAS
ncbi:MAG: site-specific integrase [Alphaproteobacteria bacterium]|nr:site-specific integrase [Alphaproteobacteria bacterium]